MTSEQWRQVLALTGSAGKLPAERRRPYVESVTADPVVCREVLSLLEEMDAEPLPDPAMAEAADSQWPHLGKQIGRFRITGSLGRGGMGEVYSSEDLELNRTVALKFLTLEASGDGQAADRFVREARAASALNHPNIVTVHEVLRIPPTLAIVMELVDGKPLREFCRGPNRLADVAHWGRQAAEALAAAHAAGIVHRDVKPENLMVRPDGYVKVLDFGLARQLTDGNSSAGVTAGTFRYMSPEQTRGAALTQATDVFSLGLVLYELAAGRHPFASESPIETAHRIATEKAPPPSRSNPLLPPPFDALVLSMLAKESCDRPTAADVSKSLAAIATSPEPAVTPRNYRWVAAASVAAVLLPGLGWIGWRLRNSGSPEPGVDPGAAAEFRPAAPLIHMAGNQSEPAFSPDGKQVAFAFRESAEGNRDIYVQRIGAAGSPVRLTSDPADEFGPQWSFDGRSIAFLRRGGDKAAIVVMPSTGGAGRIGGSLAVTTDYDVPMMTWSPAGDSLIIADNLPGKVASYHLIRLDLSTGGRRVVTSPGTGQDRAPVFSPDGRTLAFFRDLPGDIFEIHAIDFDRGNGSAGSPRAIISSRTRIRNFAWYADSRSILYTAGTNGADQLWKVPLAGGPPQPVPFTLEGELDDLATSPSGGRLAYKLSYTDSNIWRIDTQSGASERWIASAREDEDPRYSPDGSRIAFSSKRTGFAEIWVADGGGANQRALTSGRSFSGSPVWSPEGREIAYDATRAGASGIWIVDVAGGAERALTSASGGFLPYWSRDGQWIFFCSKRGGSEQIWKARSTGEGEAVQLTSNGGFEARESIDGKSVYFTRPVTGQLLRIPVEGGTEEIVPELLPMGFFRYWDIAGDGIFFVERTPPRSLRFLDLTARSTRTVATPREPPSSYIRGLSASPDGRSVLYVQRDARVQEIVIVENFR